ncbi:MAG: PH domain-containing protein, partial [Caldilineaceae bacterium]
MHRDEFRQVVNESVKESLAGQGFESANLTDSQLTQLTTAIADGVFAGLEKLIDAPMSTMNPTTAMAAAAATAAATAAAAVQDPSGAAAPLAGRPASTAGVVGVVAAENADATSGTVQAGLPVVDSAIAQSVPTSDTRQEVLIWRGRPYLTLGTIYELTSQRLRVIRGLVSNAIDEIELVRVQDTRVTQSAGERMFDIGDIAVISGDASSPALVLYNVKDPVEVREAIRKATYEERQRRRMLYRE